MSCFYPMYPVDLLNHALFEASVRLMLMPKAQLFIFKTEGTSLHRTP
jgi:hypothetical protein